MTDCVLCGKKTIFDSVSVRVVSFTESGIPIFPHDNEEQGIGVGIPLCNYHFVFANEGLIAYYREKEEVILVGGDTLRKMEGEEDSVLKTESRNNPRKEVQELAKIILNARKFVQGMMG